MSAGTYDFTVEMGTTLDLKLIYKDSTGTAVPLTGYSADMQVRASKADATILAEFKTTDSTIKLGPADGEIHILASAAVTSAWTFPIPTGTTTPQAVYDLELTDGSGNVKRLIQGKISLDPEVTR